MKRMTKKKRSSDNYVNLLIRGAGNLGKAEFAGEFFRMLQEVGDICMPTRIGVDEPIRAKYSMKNAKKLWVASEKDSRWGGGILFKGPSGLLGMVDWNHVDNSNDISLRIASKNILPNKGIKKLLTFAKNIFLWSNGYYGHAYHGSIPIFSSGIDCKTCLPGISWLNIFGKPYVNMFGVHVIESAPCYVEKFAENSYLLLASEEPSRGTPEILEKHELIKNHLGKEAFDRKDAPSQSFFTTEDIQAGRHLPSTEGYRSPDLSEYIKDPTNTTNEELFVQSNDDGTISSVKVGKQRK